MLDQPQFITICEEDENGDLALSFPEELLEAMGWKEGTTLDISTLPGTIVLREVKTPSKRELENLKEELRLLQEYVNSTHDL